MKAQEEILAGGTPVVCHIDKDLNMIPGWHYHIKVKDFYFMTPAQSYYFMMKQFIIGDMSSDSIPGLMKIGEVKAAEKFQGKRLSQLRDHVRHLWLTNSHGIQQNDPNVSYNTPKEKLTRMLQSANCLYLRDSEETMRELTPNEMWAIMKWDPKEMGEDPLIDAQFELMRVGVYSLSPASYTAGDAVAKAARKDVPRQSQLDIAAEVAAGKRTRVPTVVDPDVVKVRYKTSSTKSRVKTMMKKDSHDKSLLKRQSTRTPKK
jgi:hypothetical protein